MELPVHYQKAVHYLWYIATFECVFQYKKSHPLMFVLFLPLIIPSCLFTTTLVCLVVFKAVSVLSGCGVNLLMFALPLMLQVSGHCVLGIALVCICYLIYRAIRQVIRILEYDLWTTKPLFTYVIRLIFEECCIGLQICGLVTYAMLCITLSYLPNTLELLCIMLSYLPSMLALMAWLCLNFMKQFLVIALLAYDRWCWLASDNGKQFCCCKTMDIFPITPKEEQEILESQKRRAAEEKEKAEKQQSTDETSHVEPRPGTSQQTIRKEQIESIRRSILTTNLTKENVKDIWLKKQQSRRGRRRWSRMSNNALSVSVTPASKDW